MSKKDLLNLPKNQRKQYLRTKILNVGKSSSVDNKLTRLAILLEYEFELGIDFSRRIIKITDEINQFTFDIVDGALTEMESHGRSDVTIKICSPGGSTYYAMAIIDRIKESTCKIVTKGYGHVMSAATLILASGTRRREMAEGAFFMWHEARYDPGDLKHSEHEALVRQVKKEEMMWCKRMALLSNKNEKYWKENGVGIDAYFNSEQLKRMGVIDEIF